MKILYHHRTQGKTVEGVHIREIVRALRRAGHEVVLVSPPGVDPFAAEQPGAKKKTLAGKLLGHASRLVPQFVFELMEMAYNVSAYASLTDAVRQDTFDLIYERYAFFSIAGSLVAAKHRIPIIEEVNEISGIKRQRGQCFVRLTNWFEKSILRRVDGMVVVSSFLKERIAGYGIASDRISVLPNAVNLADFNPGAPCDDIKARLKLDGRIVAGFLGSFSRWDNLEFLISVFEEVAAAAPSAKLMLVGDGFNRAALEETVERRRLGDRIVFAGRVGRSEVQKHIAAMDICVIPHSNPFGSPVAMFEFMAMGKPVVAPRLAPITDVIVDGRNGVIFEPGDGRRLAEALTELINSPERRARIGAAARQQVLEQHTWDRNAGKIIDLHSRIIA